jgi:hypothetical protein
MAHLLQRTDFERFCRAGIPNCCYQAITQITRNGIRRQAFVYSAMLRHQFREPLIERFHRLHQIANRNHGRCTFRYGVGGGIRTLDSRSHSPEFYH